MSGYSRESATSSSCGHGHESNPQIPWYSDHYRVGLNTMLHIYDHHRRQGELVWDAGCFASQESLMKHPALDLKKMLKLLLSTGTSIILWNGSTSLHETTAIAIALLVILMEPPVDRDQRRGTKTRNQSTSFDESCQQVTDGMRKLSELDSDGAIVRFFAKRIPCSCLKEKKREHKVKTGECCYSGCRRTQLDATLMNCAACRVVKYCGKVSLWMCVPIQWLFHLLL